MPPDAGTVEIGALWLSTLQRAMARASHDVKDALNGVSVNLEVVRSRADRPDAPAAAVAQFAEAAGQQLVRMTTLVEAVLALSRVERDPADVGVTARWIAVLCGASASSADAAVELRVDGTGGSTVTRVRGDAVRLALAAPLLDAVAGSDRYNRASPVQVALDGDGPSVLVTIGAAGRRVVMPAAVAAAVCAAGVRWTETEQHLTLAFPRT